MLLQDSAGENLSTNGKEEKKTSEGEWSENKRGFLVVVCLW